MLEFSFKIFSENFGALFVQQHLVTIKSNHTTKAAKTKFTMKSSLVWVVLSQLKQGLLWLFSDKRVSNFPLDSLTPNKTFCEQNIFWQSDKKLFVCFVFRFKDVFHKSFVSYFWAKGWLGKSFYLPRKQHSLSRRRRRRRRRRYRICSKEWNCYIGGNQFDFCWEQRRLFGLGLLSKPTSCNKMFKIESWGNRKINFEPEITKDTQGVVIYTANVKAKQGKVVKVQLLSLVSVSLTA